MFADAQVLATKTQDLGLGMIQDLRKNMVYQLDFLIIVVI